MSKELLMNILRGIYNFFASWVGAIVTVLIIVFFIAQGFIIPSRSMVGTLYEGDMMIVKKFSYGIPIPKIPWIEIPVFPDIRGDRHLIPGDRPQRGDIVVFNPPGDDKTYYIKRNFAIGGDKVIVARDGIYLRPVEGDSYINEHFNGYDTSIFFGELYVKEPYSKEFLGIHYGEKGGAILPYMSYFALRVRAQFGTTNAFTGGKGIAMQPRILNGNDIFYINVPEDSFFMVGDNRDNSEDSRFWGPVHYSRVIGKPWFTWLSITLADSIESDAADPKNRYKLRWDRMFKSISTIENNAKVFDGECRYYSNKICGL